MRKKENRMKKKLKNRTNKCISLLLAAVMLLAIQGIPVLAETVGNDTLEIDYEKCVPYGDTVEITGREEPKNPVHHCVKDDNTDWGYVYFGSYPQTEVTGDALTAAITGASYNTDGDAWVDDIKYRRISKNDTNYDGYFGDSDYRYFKWERIKWRVLKNDGSTLFVVADKGLDCKDYNEEYTSITWENCTLRSWLNNEFYGMAFSSDEQGAIVRQNIVNEDNPYYGTEGGNDTSDNVFLLSIGEVLNPEYGFCEDGDAYSASRWMESSDYAHARGAYAATGDTYAGNCWWWLRSPGRLTSSAAGVDDDGDVYRYGGNVDDAYGACVPALHINLSSDLWSAVDDGGSNEKPGEGIPKNPVHHCVKDDNTDWSYVYFGSYPQTEVVVTGDEPTEAITGASYNADGDAWVNGTKYRRISRNAVVTGDEPTEAITSDYRYFKWERIKWRVLKNDGSTLFVVADKGLDCKDYNEEYTSITWENCTLRSWLNNEFYGMAFSSDEQGAIVRQNIVNEDNPYYGTEGGNDTSDNVFLLSIGEVLNPEYGFCEDGDAYSASRWMESSDYAHARGAYAATGDTYAGNCWWWLRSPGSNIFYAAYVYNYGIVYRIGDDVSYDYGACVPALHINLSSDLWSTADDGSSGEGGNGGTNEDRISSFRLTPSASVTTDAPVIISGSLDLSAQAETSPSILQQEIDAITWTSSNTTVAQVTNISAAKSPDSRSASLSITVTPYTEGTTTITGKTSTGQTAVCELNVKNPAGTPSQISLTKATATLKKTSCVYNGKAQKPSVTVKLGSKKLTKDKDYKLTYKNNKKVGTASVIITGIGEYTGTLTKTFKIVPKGTSISGKVKAKSKGFTVSWKKQKSITGYQLQYSTSKKFAKKATVTKTIKKKSATKWSSGKLKPNKIYYIRLRTYQTVKGKKYESAWSKAKTVKTRK